MQKPRKNAFSTDHVWPPEKLAAWVDMPKQGNGWTAPATEPYREQWRKWWEKWGRDYHYTPIYEGYKKIDAEKQKLLDGGSSSGYIGTHQGVTGSN